MISERVEHRRRDGTVQISQRMVSARELQDREDLAALTEFDERPDEKVDVSLLVRVLRAARRRGCL